MAQAHLELRHLRKLRRGAPLRAKAKPTFMPPGEVSSIIWAYCSQALALKPVATASTIGLASLSFAVRTTG